MRSTVLAAGAPEERARAAAESIPVSEHLATKQDIVVLDPKMWRSAGLNGRHLPTMPPGPKVKAANTHESI